ncbi:MAG: hypothetical protein ABF335_11730 [Alphaproteobacteria bacterium]
MNNSLIRYGFILILLGLLAGFLGPMAKAPSLLISSHMIGMMGGILLIAMGAVWSRFTLSERGKSILKWSWLYTNFGNWLGVLTAAMTGATNFLEINGGPPADAGFANLFVSFMMLSISLAAIVASVTAIMGLKSDAT